MPAFSKNSLQRNILFPLYYVVFIAFFGFAAAIPTFTNLLMDPTLPELRDLALSTRTFLLGILLSMYPLGQFVGGSILGTLSDQIGRKKTLLITLLLAATSYLGIAYSLWHFHLGLLFVFLFIGGLCEANVVVAQNAIADVMPNEQRSYQFGYIFASVNLGYIAGAIGGGFLSDPSILSWFRPWTPFLVVFVLLSLAYFLVQSTFSETFVKADTSKLSWGESFTNIKNIFTDHSLRFYYAISALVNFCTYGYFRSYPMYLTHTFELKVSKLSLYMAYVGAPIVIFNIFFIRPLSKALSPFFLTLISSLFFGISLCAIPAFPYRSSLWITLFLTTSFATICLTASASLISHAASEDRQGRVMGNHLSIQGLMTALSSLGGGMIGVFGIHWILVFFGSLGIVTALILSSKRTLFSLKSPENKDV